MTLLIPDIYNDFHMSVFTSDTHKGAMADQTRPILIFQLEDQARADKRRFDADVEFEMTPDEVRQLHSFLGNILKSDWAK